MRDKTSLNMERLISINKWDVSQLTNWHDEFENKQTNKQTLISLRSKCLSACWKELLTHTLY